MSGERQSTNSEQILDDHMFSWDIRKEKMEKSNLNQVLWEGWSVILYREGPLLIIFMDFMGIGPIENPDSMALLHH